MAWVVGIDGWKGGWVGIALDGGAFAAALVDESLESLLDRCAGCDVVAIDMPIGFPTDAPRRADLSAREILGPRRAAVFLTLPEGVYRADTHAQASELTRQRWGKGISQQAYALRVKVLEVAALIEAGRSLVEAHPEVCFAEMAGEPLAHSKRTWNGQAQRRQLLANNGIVLPDDLGEAAVVPVDDVLDAAACAWTADRIRLGTARTFPAEPDPGEPVITA